MAFFRGNEPEDEELYTAEEEEEQYDDGFDELTEEEEPELSEEERAELRRSRFRLAAGAANLVAVIGGAVLILVLLALLFNMINFVSNDMTRNFSLFQTNF
jgi:hypothetical protein